MSEERAAWTAETREWESPALAPIDMLQSEEIADLAAALAKAQAKMGHAPKDSENPHFRNRFASLASVWDTWREVGPANGLAVTQLPTVTPHGPALVTQITHSSGQWMRSVYPLRPVKDDPQGMGSALTYARRYALSAMVGISQDDDDANAASDGERREAKHSTVSGGKMNKFDDVCAATGAERAILPKFDGKCFECGSPVGKDAGGYAVQVNGKWDSYCGCTLTEDAE